MAKGSKDKRTTKYELVQAVYSKLGGFSKKEAADLVDLIFELMKETLGRGRTSKSQALATSSCVTRTSAKVATRRQVSR